MPRIKATIAQFLELVPDILETQAYNGRPIPVMIRGKHGIGKSEIIHQLGKRLNRHVENIRAGEMTEGDFVGIPEGADSKRTGNRITKFLAPEFIDRSCAEPTILFLDEINRGTEEVQQGMFKLADSGQVGSHVLHPMTMVVSAVNPAGGEYQVSELDPAANDRWFVVDLEPSSDEWFRWAKEKGVHEIVVGYLENFSDALDPPDTFEIGKVYPSRRSWTRFASVLGKMEDRVGGPANVDRRILELLVSGFAGETYANTFAKYYTSHAKDNGFKLYIEKGNFRGVKAISMEEASEVLEILDQRKIFNSKMSDSAVKNVVKFASLIPSEALATLFNKHINTGKRENFEKIMAEDLNGQRCSVHYFKTVIDNN